MFCCNSFYSSRCSSFSSKKWCPAEGGRFHGDSLQWHPGPIQAVLWFRETVTVPTKVNRPTDISNGHRHAKTSYREVKIQLYLNMFPTSSLICKHDFSMGCKDLVKILIFIDVIWDVRYCSPNVSKWSSRWIWELQHCSSTENLGLQSFNNLKFLLRSRSSKGFQSVF